MCIDPHQTGSVGKGSNHLQLIKFWPSRAPRKGVFCGAKIFGSVLLQPYSITTFSICLQCLRLSERFFFIHRDLLYDSDTELFSKTWSLPVGLSLHNVPVLTCVVQYTVFSCLVIVLHCMKGPWLFVRYLNLSNCIIVGSCAMALFRCAFSRIYYAALLRRMGPHIALHSVCPSVCLSVCPSVRLSVRPVIVYFILQ